MAALDSEHEIADDRNVSSDHMHVNAEPVPQHAAGVTYPGCLIDRIAERHRVQDCPAFAHRMPAPRAEHSRNVPLADRRAGNIDGCGNELAYRSATGNRDDHRLELHFRRALSEIGTLPDRGLRLGKIDNAAG